MFTNNYTDEVLNTQSNFGTVQDLQQNFARTLPLHVINDSLNHLKISDTSQEFYVKFLGQKYLSLTTLSLAMPNTMSTITKYLELYDNSGVSTLKFMCSGLNVGGYTYVWQVPTNPTGNMLSIASWNTPLAGNVTLAPDDVINVINNDPSPFMINFNKMDYPVGGTGSTVLNDQG